MVIAPFEWDFSSREAEVLREIPRRLAPLGVHMVFLFGSRATGTARKDSDFDLVVVREVRDRSEPRSATIRRALRGLRVPFDVIVYTPDEWESQRGHPQAFAHEVALTGRLLHDSA